MISYTVGDRINILNKSFTVADQYILYDQVFDTCDYNILLKDSNNVYYSVPMSFLTPIIEGVGSYIRNK